MTTRPPEPSWVVLVPVKRSAVAKSRLTGITAGERAELARAFPADCAEAALRAAAVRQVVAITDDEEAARTLRALGAEVIPDEPDAGLNPALEHAAGHARGRYGAVPLAVLSGDLPALRPGELGTALERAGRCRRAFLPDRSGRGTTLLAAVADAPLEPRFGVDSCRAHAAGGAERIGGEGLDSVRRDVDTVADLREAVELGVGRHTREVLERHGIAERLLH
jgi:2-phospho-L-lactate/phosphoenolpyruvate guanylyltransferase